MIKNLIFDFGDVFLNLDKAATAKELQKYRIKEFSRDMDLKNQQYEKGLISSDAFVADYCNKFPDLSPEGFTSSWNAILVDFPQYRLEFLQQLASEGKYKLILLSNTNDLHIEWVKEQVSFFEQFRSCFDAFYLSQEVNLRKPDPTIFEMVLKEQHLKPSETLFIDDTAENTEAAEKIGIRTWNINPEKEDVVDLFEVKKELF